MGRPLVREGADSIHAGRVCSLRGFAAPNNYPQCERYRQRTEPLISGSLAFACALLKKDGSVFGQKFGIR
jgi:hypothetical protein